MIDITGWILTNPRSSDALASVDLDIQIGDSEPIQFKAIPTDIEEHGRAIYEKALAGEFGEVAISPSADHKWVDGAWLFDADEHLTQTKAQKKQEIDMARDAALNGGFEFDGHLFDSDAKSMQRISSLATLALMNSEFTTPYVTQDNKTITLDATQLRGLGVAAAQHESAQVFKARQLKDAVIAATSADDVLAIKWE